MTETLTKTEVSRHETSRDISDLVETRRDWDTVKMFETWDTAETRTGVKTWDEPKQFTLLRHAFTEHRQIVWLAHLDQHSRSQELERGTRCRPVSPPHHLCPHSSDSWRDFFSSDKNGVNNSNYCVVVLKCLALSTTLILANWTELIDRLSD